MYKVYIYIFDTLADWEIRYVTAELNSKRFFKKDAPNISVKTVSITKEPVKSMGGLNIIPDCVIDDIIIDKNTVLILPGGDTWDNQKHKAIIDIATKLISIGSIVCAICGATVALANAGLLDNRPHTSNGVGFLEIFSSNYKGKEFYVDSPSVADNNLITASGTGNLLWTKQIIQCLNVFEAETLEAWYSYYRTGEAKYFYTLMQTLPCNLYLNNKK